MSLWDYQIVLDLYIYSNGCRSTNSHDLYLKKSLLPRYIIIIMRCSSIPTVLYKQLNTNLDFLEEKKTYLKATFIFKKKKKTK